MRADLAIQLANPATLVFSAAEHLAAGGLVALPTETVYGLGADASNPEAVAKIFAAKGRPADHPLIVHVATDDDLTRWAVNIPPVARALTRTFWPGPLTIILQRSQHIPLAVTGGQETVGLRAPNHPVAQALLNEFSKIGSGIIAAPSANKFGRISPTQARHVVEEFGVDIGQNILLLDGGECAVGIESTIVDLSGLPDHLPRLLRPGQITRANIDAQLMPFGLALAAHSVHSAPHPNTQTHLQFGPLAGTVVPRVSGSLAAHYAPRTPMRLVESEQLVAFVEQTQPSKRIALFAQTSLVKTAASCCIATRTAPPDPAHYAHDLYTSLRELDHVGADIIVVQAPEISAPWEAVNDRLQRAETGSGEQ